MFFKLHYTEVLSNVLEKWLPVYFSVENKQPIF